MSETRRTQRAGRDREGVVPAARRKLDLLVHLAGDRGTEARGLEIGFYRVAVAMGPAEVRELMAGEVPLGWAYRVRPWTRRVRERMVAEGRLRTGEGLPPVCSMERDGQEKLDAGDVVVVEMRDPGRCDVTFEADVLELKYKHAGDFGIMERFGQEGLRAFQSVLVEHVQDSTEVYLVSYRGANVRAYLHGGRIVLTTAEGSFITGHVGSKRQVEHARSHMRWNS